MSGETKTKTSGSFWSTNPTARFFFILNIGYRKIIAEGTSGSWDMHDTKKAEFRKTRSERLNKLIPMQRLIFPKASDKPIDKLDESTSATLEY